MQKANLLVWKQYPKIHPPEAYWCLPSSTIQLGCIQLFRVHKHTAGEPQTSCPGVKPHPCLLKFESASQSSRIPSALRRPCTPHGQQLLNDSLQALTFVP